MKIHSIRFKNFMVFRDLYKVFGDKDVIGIMGEFKNNSEKSNKAGKTALIEGILYGLYGHSRADKEVELIHHGQEEMSVEVILKDGNEKFKVLRTRNIDNTGSVEVTGREGSKKREAQSTINKLIGYNKDEFIMTAYFPQGEINNFMNLKSAEQQSHFMEWIKNSYWKKIFEKTNQRQTFKTKKVTYVLGQIESAKEDSIDRAKVKDNLRAIKEEKEQLIKNKNKCGKLLKKAQTKISKLDKSKRIKEKLLALNVEIENYKSKYDYKLSHKKHWRSTVARLAKLNKEPPCFTKKDQENLTIAKTDLVNILKFINTATKRCGVCPILEETCDRITTTKKQKEELNAKHKECIEAIKKGAILEKQLERHNRLKSDLQSEIDNSRCAFGGIKDNKNYLNSLILKKNELQREAKLISSVNYEVVHIKARGLSDKIEAIDYDISDLDIEIGSIKSDLKRYKKQRKKIKKLKDELKSLREDIGHLQYLKLMFGKRGIPSLEIENAFDELAEEINFVLKKLKTTFEVQFEADREIGKWEQDCLECGYNYLKGTRIHICPECRSSRQKKRKEEFKIKIIDDKRPEGFYMESGAGRALFSISLRVALARLKQRQNQSKFSTLFLDEPDAPFDKINREAFIKLITTTFQKEFNFEQIFWISHSKDIQGSIPHVLKVIKGEKASKAIWLT